MQSQLLTQFYKEYLAWVQSGAPIDNVMHFSRRHGLCSNLINWSSTLGHYPEERYPIIWEMRAQFINADLSEAVPFNEIDDYFAEGRNNACHLNEQRINWVKRHVDINSVEFINSMIEPEAKND